MFAAIQGSAGNKEDALMPFYQVSDIEPFELLPGLRIRAPFGKNLMLSYLEFDRDAVVPFHSHPHEQGGIVLQGKIELTIGDEAQNRGAGLALHRPAEHAASGRVDRWPRRGAGCFQSRARGLRGKVQQVCSSGIERSEVVPTPTPDLPRGDDAMKALVLEDVTRFAVRERPAPAMNARDVLIRIGAVGICGTDLHIFNGFANYNRDEHGYQIPLTKAPQILGHEFCGVVEAVGKDVTKFSPGDRVIADQVLNCHSKRRDPLCEYCGTGDSHQCAYLDEMGITGLPGAFADFVSLPEPNVLKLPAEVPMTKAAIIEPMACVLHASDRMERSVNRYEFEGKYRIRNILITGAGPSGLLFIQYLRNVKKIRRPNLHCRHAGQPSGAGGKAGRHHARRANTRHRDGDRKRTKGELIHYWIDASGAGPIFDLPPLIMRRQATFLFYGSGHTGRDVGCLVPFQFMETNIVTSCGASGGFEADGTPVVYRRSMEYVRDGLIHTEPLLTHHYQYLDELQNAFQVDALADDFIKGAWIANAAL